MQIGLRTLGVSRRAQNRGAEIASANYTTAGGFDNITTPTSATSFDAVGGTTMSRSYLTVAASGVSKTYEATFRLSTISSGVIGMHARANATGSGTTIASLSNITAGSTGRLVFTTQASSVSVLWLSSDVSASFTVDQISIRELT